MIEAIYLFFLNLKNKISLLVRMKNYSYLSSIYTSSHY